MEYTVEIFRVKHKIWLLKVAPLVQNYTVYIYTCR